jgi:biotin operon repressor
MMTYDEISEKYKMPIRELRRSASYLKIKGIYVGKTKSFTKEEIELIIRHKVKSSPKYRLYNKRKIAMVQSYFKYGSCTKVAKLLKLDRGAVNKAVKEYQSTGYIIVESKLNYE